MHCWHAMRLTSCSLRRSLGLACFLHNAHVFSKGNVNELTNECKSARAFPKERLHMESTCALQN
eukprot:827494-Amphidinium_carterae.2